MYVYLAFKKNTMYVNKHQAEKSKGASLELNEINKLSL